MPVGRNSTGLTSRVSMRLIFVLPKQRDDFAGVSEVLNSSVQKLDRFKRSSFAGESALLRRGAFWVSAGDRAPWLQRGRDWRSRLELAE
jgi:hypothetical protein